MIHIPLHRTDGSVKAWAVVSDCDARLAHFRWWLSQQGYAARHRPWPDRRVVLMHRDILGLQHGDPREADHMNRDRLDNRRGNLRIVTRQQNAQNLTGYGTSQYRGVAWFAQTGKWHAYSRAGGRRVHLGYYESEEEAAKVASDFRREHMPGAVEDVAA